MRLPLGEEVLEFARKEILRAFKLRSPLAVEVV